jgi:tetratricopeptide (TPR) repeat protein
LGLSALVVLVVGWTVVSAPVPEEDAALRKKALALNDVTGDDPIRGEIKTLVADKAGAKKLVVVAAQMAKEKPQPFSYNGAYILAASALQVQELDASRTLFLVCADQARMLQSPSKLGQSYRGLMALADLFYLDKKYDKSAKLAQEFLEIVERQPGAAPALKIELLWKLVRAMDDQGKRADATKMVDNLVKARNSDWRILELKAKFERKLENYDAAAKAYQEALDRAGKDEELSRPDNKDERTEILAEIRLELIDALFLGKKYDQSAKLGQELLETLQKQGAAKRSQRMVLQRLIQALVQQGKMDEASRLVDKLGRAGDNLEDLEQKAFVRQLVGRYDEAARIYEQMLTKVEKDESLESDAERKELENQIRYMLSGVYIDLNRLDKAVEQLKLLLTREPDNSTYNNDLGYIWADHDMNLDEAEKMIRKAIDEDRKQRKQKGQSAEADKDNAAYLDSLGWVLFKKKNYKEAKKYLLEAVQYKDGQHVEIMDHLADCHMALAEKADAIAVWQKALKLDTPTLREKQRRTQVEKKLKEKQQP